MTQRQLQGVRVLSLVEAGKITLREAAEKIGRSYRQAKRIWKRVREEGVKGVIHGNSGKPSNHRTPQELRQKVLQLSQRCYGEFKVIAGISGNVVEEFVQVRRRFCRRERVIPGMISLLEYECIQAGTARDRKLS